MATEVLPTVELDGGVRKFLKHNGSSELKVVISIDSTFYGGCCGAYEEKSLKIEAVEMIDENNSPEFVYLSHSPSIYIHRDLLPLLKSKGDRLVIKINSDKSLYCNLDSKDFQDRFQIVP